jgi:Zn-dependent metalloprotease
MFRFTKLQFIGLLITASLGMAAQPSWSAPSREKVSVQFDDSGDLKLVCGDLGPGIGPEAIKATVGKYRALFSDPKSLSDLRLAKLVTAGSQKVYRFQQTYQGLEVLGSSLTVAVQQGRLKTLINGLKPNLAVRIKPGINSQEAQEVAQQVLPMDDGRISTRLVVFAERSRPVLAYAVAYDDVTVLVDANNAQILKVESPLND